MSDSVLDVSGGAKKDRIRKMLKMLKPNAKKMVKKGSAFIGGGGEISRSQMKDVIDTRTRYGR